MIMETDKVIQVGNIVEGGEYDNPQRGRVYSPEGISPCMNGAGGGGNLEPKVLLDMENPKVKQVGNMYGEESNSLRGRIFDSEGISPTILSHEQGGGCEPKIVEQQEPSFLRAACGFGKPAERDIPSAVTSSAYAANNFVKEPKMVQKVGDRGTDNYSMNEISNTIPANPMSDRGQVLVESKTRYRIRKLTEREVFRLMDVSEEDIDKIQAAGISKTAQYRLAGNSIVVSCLYHLFRKMFVQTECETQQLSLF